MVNKEMVLLWVNQNKPLLNKMLRKNNLMGTIRMPEERVFKLIFGSQKVEGDVTTDFSELALGWDNTEKKSYILRKKPAEMMQDFEAAGIEESELKGIKWGN